ncbi:hypothetical protein [Paenirhodobacter populi]|nr:hypothetical protein [Sinirhodobacter populi]
MSATENTPSAVISAGLLVVLIASAFAAPWITGRIPMTSPRWTC